MKKKQPYSNNFNARIQHVEPNKRILAYILDIVSVALLTLIFYFASFNLLFKPIFHYDSYNNTRKQVLETYSITLTNKDDYSKYESVIKDFYFVYYPEEIKDNFNTAYNKNFSITHIYSIKVLNLVEDPNDGSSTAYNDYFAYYQNEDGTYDTEQIGYERNHVETKNYYRYMKEIFKTSYDQLPSYLSIFNKEYQEAVLHIKYSEFSSRISSFLLSIIILYIALPFILKDKVTIFEKVFNIVYINKKDGYYAKVYKVLLRPLIYFILPLVGIIFFSLPSFVILGIGPLFINALLIIFSSLNNDLYNRILQVIAVNKKESIIFKNRKEEEIYELEHPTYVDDPSFLESLESISSISLHESRSEEIKK